jgi:phage protein D
MSKLRPFISIVGPAGHNIVPGLGPAFLGITITDQEGEESDECIIRMVDKSPFNIPPAKGTKYIVEAGFSDSGDRIGGIYTYQTFRKSGDPEGGKVFELVCRAADFIDKMKTAESAHYDEENGFGTAGKIFEKLAADAGVAARIDPEIANIKIPYRLRFRQEAFDFAADIADEIGAVIKPQNDLFVVRKRGAGKTASGKSLPSCPLNEQDCYSYDFDIDPRPQHKEIAGPWMDINSGRLKEAVATTSATFSRLMMVHPLPSEEEAKRAAQAAGQSLNQSSGTGSIEAKGSALAQAGAPAPLSGYGPGVDDLQWEIASVEHNVIAEDDGWIMSVELQTRE